MRSVKKSLAALLAALMLISALPVQTLAEDSAHAEDDVVLYCLGPEQTDETYLVCWPEYLEAIQGYGIAGSCAAFEPDGSYAIPLPDGVDTVCFLYFDGDGEPVTQPERFSGEDRTVTVKGHAFRAARGGEPAQGGSVIDPLSLFPTKVVQVEADLRGLFPVELAQVKLADLLGADQQNTLEDEIAWSYGNDSFQVAGKDATIDLSAMWRSYAYGDSSNGYYSQRTIVILSKPDPTASDLVRYVVTVKASTEYRGLLTVKSKPNGNDEKYPGAGTAGTSTQPNEPTLYWLNSGDTQNGCSLENGTTIWIGFDDDFITKTPKLDNLTCTVYKGSYDDAAKIPAGAEEAANMWSTWGANGQPASSGYSYTNFPAMRDPQNPAKRPEYPAFTLVIKRGDKVLMTVPFRVSYHVNSLSHDPYSYVYGVDYLYKEKGTNTGYTGNSPEADNAVAAYELIDSSQDQNDNIRKYSYTFMLKEGLESAGPYVLRMSAYGYIYEPKEPQDPDAEPEYEEKNMYASDCIAGAYVGTYVTLEEAQAAAAASPDTVKDIKEDLFGTADQQSSSPTTPFGYSADFSNKGKTISIFGLDGEVWQITVQTRMYAAPTTEEVGGIANPPGDTRSLDTYFYVTGAGDAYDSYYMSRSDDSYYDNGYQTIFLLKKDGSPADAEKIVPTFMTGRNVNVFARHNVTEAGVGENQAPLEVSGQTEHPFTPGEAIHYSAASERKTHLRNYWITFVTQQSGGPQLFINGVTNLDASHRQGNKADGAPIREVLMTAGGHHDIFVANIGDQEVKNLKVELKNAQNVKLDEYWDFGTTRTLAAFTTTKRDPQNAGYDYGELFNVTKIRLVPAGNGGTVSGTLVISGDGVASQEIILSGTAGVPKITTTTMPKAVKYVPYSALIQTNNMRGDNRVSFSPASAMPAGLEVMEDGEIYGAPQRAGTYNFSVRMSYNGRVVETKQFTLEVLDNTDYNVYHASDSSYDIKVRIGTQTPGQDDTSDVNATNSWVIQAGDLPGETFTSEGAYAYFTKVWLDGVELRPEQYTDEEGSTKITQLDAALGGNRYNGVHTIATEFREGGAKGTLKRTSQNYYVEGGTNPPPPSNPSRPSSTPSGGSGGSSGGSGSSGSGGSSGGGTTTQTPTAPMSFSDVVRASWYYDDVNWAYQRGLMVGESSSAFAPNSAISQATIVTVLARMLNVNLDRYKGMTSPTVPAGAWYTQAAVWAQRTGILPSDVPFTGTAPIAREDMAIMLQNYLIAMGVKIDENIAQVQFSDAHLMSDSGLQAFRVLYHYDIFRGVGGMQMDPTGTTTRAQFAALIRRISSFTETYKQK